VQILYPHFASFDFRKAVGKRKIARFYRFDFRTAQFDSAFDRVFDKIIETGFSVFRDDLFSVSHTFSII